MTNISIDGKIINPNTALVTVTGHLDTVSSHHLEVELQKLIDSGFCRLILELSGITHICSSGIGLIFNFLHQTKEKQGNLRLLTPSDRVLTGLTMVGALDMMKISDKIENLETL